MHKVSKRTEELSKPRTASKIMRLDHEDFRGLLHTDFTQALSKIKPQIAVLINSETKNLPKKQESIGGLDEFEARAEESKYSKNLTIEVINKEFLRVKYLDT